MARKHIKIVPTLPLIYEGKEVVYIVVKASKEDIANLPKKIPSRTNCGQIQVVQYTLANRYVTTYNSLTEAAGETGINKSNISKCLNKKLKTAGGYKWRQGVRNQY